MKHILTVLAVAVLTLTACAQKKAETASTAPAHKTLVAYFSATGTTKAAAVQLAKEVNADLMEIAPEVAYTAEDLDWHNERSRSSVEMKDETSRPAIKQPTRNAADYDTIYVGFPIWWGVAPRVVNTYLDKCNLMGKTVIPFATSGSSTIDKAEKALRDSYPKANWQKGMLKNK